MEQADHLFDDAAAQEAFTEETFQLENQLRHTARALKQSKDWNGFDHRERPGRGPHMGWLGYYSEYKQAGERVKTWKDVGLRGEYLELPEKVERSNWRKGKLVPRVGGLEPAGRCGCNIKSGI